MSLSEYHARRARLGFEPPVRSPVVIIPPPRKPRPKPVNLPKLLSKYRLAVDFKPVVPVRLARSATFSAAKQIDYATVTRIIAETCDKYDIPVRELLGASRESRLILPRQEACWRARNETGLSAPELGRCFGNRDHTTILYSIRSHEARLAGLSYRKISRTRNCTTRQYRGRIDAGTVGP